MTEPPTTCRLYVVLEAGSGASEQLAAALAAADLAAVLIAPAPGHALDPAAARPLAEQAARAGVAALIREDAQLAKTVRADGVHLLAHDDPHSTYRTARERLGSDGIVGAEAGISRHDAMVLAEAGADYVGFGAPPHLTDRDKARVRRDELVAWWATIFEVPCVAFDVETPDEAGRLAAAGADFVAVTLPAGLTAAAAGSLVAGISQAIQDKPDSGPASSRH